MTTTTKTTQLAANSRWHMATTTTTNKKTMENYEENNNEDNWPWCGEGALQRWFICWSMSKDKTSIDPMRDKSRTLIGPRSKDSNYQQSYKITFGMVQPVNATCNINLARRLNICSWTGMQLNRGEICANSISQRYISTVLLNCISQLYFLIVFLNCIYQLSFWIFFFWFFVLNCISQLYFSIVFLNCILEHNKRWVNCTWS